MDLRNRQLIHAGLAYGDSSPLMEVASSATVFGTTIQYSSPTLNGFTGIAIYRLGEQANRAGATNLGLHGTYSSGKFMAALSAQRLRINIAVPLAVEQNAYLAGANYDFGGVKPYGNVGKTDIAGGPRPACSIWASRCRSPRQARCWPKWRGPAGLCQVSSARGALWPLWATITGSLNAPTCTRCTPWGRISKNRSHCPRNAALSRHCFPRQDARRGTVCSSRSGRASIIKVPRGSDSDAFIRAPLPPKESSIAMMYINCFFRYSATIPLVI
jgi:hypothetical protein